GVVSDRILVRTGNRVTARRNVIVTGMLGGFVFLLPVMLVHDINVAALSLAAAFFSVELVVGPIWAVPMDIAPKYSGSASGMMNCGLGPGATSPRSVLGYRAAAPGGWPCPSAARLARLLRGPPPVSRTPPEKRFEPAQLASAPACPADPPVVPVAYRFGS